MIRPLIILTLLLLLLSCNRSQRKLETKIIDSPEQTAIPKQIDMLEPDHDTLPNGIRLLDNIDSGMVNYYKEVVGSDTLKGGYITCYGIDDSTKYFYLRNRDKLYLLNQTPIYTSTWSLGILEKDFDTFFMTQIDNGNGCPSSYQIFDKRTGKNILGDDVKAYSYAFLQDTLFMLYESWNKHKPTNNITLFNVKTKTKEIYKLPDNLPEFCDIQIAKLSRKNLKLSFETYVGDNFESTKTYSR
jgi:hypothetical protein